MEKKMYLNRVPDDKDQLTQKILHLYNLKAGDKFDTKEKKIIHTRWDQLFRSFLNSNNDDRRQLVQYTQNIVSDLISKERDPDIEDLVDKMIEILVILGQTYRKDSFIDSYFKSEIIKLRKWLRGDQ